MPVRQGSTAATRKIHRYSRSFPSYKRESGSHDSSFSWFIMTSQDFSTSDHSFTSFDTSNPTSFSTNPNSSPSEHRVPEFATPAESEYHTSKEGSASEIVLLQEEYLKLRDHTFAMTSSFSVCSPLRFPSILRGLQIPLPSLGPQLLRVSHVRSPELDLSLYVGTQRRKTRLTSGEVNVFSDIR